MRKLVVTTFMTLEGVMQAPGRPDEDRDGGFDHGGWSVGYWDEMMGEVAGDVHLAADEILFGRRSYEILLGHWTKVGDRVSVPFNISCGTCRNCTTGWT